MHICHVVTGFGGGVYTSVRQIVEYQCTHGHRVTVIRDFRGPYPREDLSDYPSEAEFIEWPVPREISVKEDRSAYSELYRHLERLMPDIIHCHCAKAGFMGRVIAHRLGIPVIYSPRGLPFYRADVSRLKRGLYFVLEYLLASLGAVIVACSAHELQGVKRLTKRHELITNGIDLADIDRIGTALTTRHHEPSDKPFTIASVGLINQARNPQLVSRQALLSPPSWRWIWIGEGELNDVLVGHERVEMLGWMPREKAIETLLSADVLLHPSKWEGMPLVVLEAMALGLPVVASNIVGNADVVEDGRTGFLIDEEPAYLRALLKLEADRTMREDLGIKGRQRVEANFSVATLAPKWLDVYRKEISRMSRR